MNELRRGSETGRPSSKATNSEIVKALTVLTQGFLDHNPDNRAPEHPLDVDYAITISETNLVQRISMALNAYRQQKDRMADIMDSMKRIASGE